MTDIPYGRVLKIDSQKQVSECVRYDGEPNGMAIREDGTILVADYKQVCHDFDLPPELHTLTSVSGITCI